jgi:CysZ protein
VLTALSTVASYLLAQVLFAVLIMDWMSRITERMTTGRNVVEADLPVIGQMLFLVRQEIPRAVLPLLLGMVLMIAGWLTPVGVVTALISAGITAVFLAWDNTDLLPARRMVPFGDRWRMLMRSLPFHLGFGLAFLVPVLNVLFLSFAPVGATLWALERGGRK